MAPWAAVRPLTHVRRLTAAHGAIAYWGSALLLKQTRLLVAGSPQSKGFGSASVDHVKQQL